MLKVYTNKMYLPKDMELVTNVNLYYNNRSNPFLVDDDFEKRILKEIEGAYATSRETFVGKFIDAGIYRRFLSSGTKACLLAYYFPNMVIDFCESGFNVFPFVVQCYKEGNVFYDDWFDLPNKLENAVSINNVICQTVDDIQEVLDAD